MKKRKLRVGMIGAGGISDIHCQGWARLDDCEVVAITDIDRNASARRAEQYDIPSIEPTTQRLLGRKDIDVVDIVTPNRFHKPGTVAALRAGKHVLCEKPLALTPKEVDAMIAASEKSGKKLMCAQHERFMDNSRAMKEYITTNPLGEVYYARAWYNRRRALPTTRGFLLKANSGGGCCIDVGVHVLDLALHLMGNFSPVSVTGIAVTKIARQKSAWSEFDWGFYNKRLLDVEDFAAGMIRFANGAALTLECSFMLNQKPRAQQRIDLFGTRRGMTWPDCECYDTTSGDYVNVALDVRDSGEKAHHAGIRAFAEAVTGNKPVPVPPQQSRAVMAILDGLYRSQKSGKEVKI